MKISIAARCHLTVGEGFCCSYIFPLMLLLFGLCLGLISPSMALAANPGDSYVFPAESPVAPDGTSQLGGPTLSGNIALWTEYDSSLRKTRLFFKDLSKGPGEPGHALISDEYNGATPEINQAGNRVVWSEMIGALRQVYSKDVDFSGSFSGCTGTVNDCATALSPGNSWQENPSISPDGSKVAWEYGRGHGSQIHLYDFNTGIVQELYGMPGGDQEYPSVDNEWVVWEDNRDFNSFVFPLNQHIYAKRIGSPDAPVSLADNGGSAHASVGSAKIGRNPNNEPVVVYVKTATGNSSSFTIRLHNLADGSDIPLATSNGRLDSPSINGDNVVWLDCSVNWRCDVILHNLSTDVTQTVSQDPGLGANRPVVSNSSGYIVWQTTQSSPATIYYNRMGDTAQMLANRYAPHLYLHSEEYFEPRKVDIFTAGEGTRLIERNNGNIISRFEWPELTLGSLGQFSGVNNQPGNTAEGKYIDLPGNVNLAWSTPTEWLLKHDYVDRYNDLANRPEYPEQYYARVVRNSSADRFEIQYWIPYYFNNFDNYHEGDWEMVQVDLDSDFEPRGAAFSQHTGALKKSWAYLDHRDTHAVSYVGKGSHANYFAAGEHHVQVENWLDGTDYAEVHDPIHEPLVEVLPDVSSANLGTLVGGPFGWLAYQGAWGEFAGVPWLDGPQGPAATPEHNGIWDDPFSWYDGLPSDGAPLYSGVPYDESYYSLASPADIHLYDNAGNHVGKNTSGGIDEQIPGAEYLEIPELHRKTIMVHGGDASADYKVVLEGTGEGTFDLTIGSPDRSSNTSETVDYVDVPVTSATRVEMTPALSTDYALQIDREGDGLVDEQRLPNSVIRYDIDLTAPSNVTDLAVTDVSSGTAMLSFTAPGDDAGAGTAQYYDVRYATVPITEENWKEAEPVETIPLPHPAGSTESLTFAGLEAGTTYYFALKAKDEVLQTSGLSNVAQATTSKPSLTWARQRVYWANWADYSNRHLSIEYRMSNVGTGTAIDPTVQASFCTPASVYIVTQLPLGVVSNLSPGASASVTLKYFVPTTVYNFTTSTYANSIDDVGRLYWFPAPMS
ncbi:MAG: fibronectin type III domain-containing protein [Thermoleophilia bacterium]